MVFSADLLTHDRQISTHFHMFDVDIHVQHVHCAYMCVARRLDSFQTRIVTLDSIPKCWYYSQTHCVPQLTNAVSEQNGSNEFLSTILPAAIGLATARRLWSCLIGEILVRHDKRSVSPYELCEDVERATLSACENTLVCQTLRRCCAIFTGFRLVKNRNE